MDLQVRQLRQVGRTQERVELFEVDGRIPPGVQAQGRQVAQSVVGQDGEGVGGRLAPVVGIAEVVLEQAQVAEDDLMTRSRRRRSRRTWR